MDEQTPKGPGGRPTKYKPEYCDMIVEHFLDGGHMLTFAHEVSVSKQTLYDWCDKYPAFLDARERANNAAAVYLNNIAKGLMTGDLKGLHGTWSMNMKNRFNWSDKVETRDVGQDDFATPDNLLAKP